MPKTDEEESAERIQAIARGRKSRRRTASRSTTEKKERELAATKIQARNRGKRERALAEKRKEQTAATLLIQTMWRGRKERRKMSTRLKGGRPMLDKDIKSGLYQLGRTPYSLRHAYISLKVNDEYVNSLDAIEQYVNLSTIEMRNNFLADLTPLRALPYLTSLNVSRNKLTEVLAFSPPRCENGAMHAPPPSPWAAGEDVGRAWATGDRHIGSLLRDADLSFNEIEEIRDVSEHRNLQTLVLDSNRIGALAMGQLSGLPALHTLHLSNNCLTQIRGLDGLPLEELSIDHNQIAYLETLDTLPRLQRLFCSHNRLTSLDGLQRCTALNLIDASSNQLSVIREVEYLQPLPTLNALILAGNELATLSFYRLRVIMRLQRITLLDAERVTSEEKVKAINLYGGEESDVGHRADISRKIFPGESFDNHLPPYVEVEASPLQAANYEDYLTSKFLHDTTHVAAAVGQ